MKTAAAGFAIYLAGCSIGWAAEEQEQPEPLPAMKKVVEQITAEKLPVDKHGVVQALPGELRASSPEGVYVTGKPAAPAYVLFVFWRGKAANLRGRLYAPGAALKVGSEVSVRTPIPLAQSPTAMNDVKIDGQLAPNWYLVSRSLD
jgi:hypothetical protein